MFTEEPTYRQNLLSVISDQHKSAYGFRPDLSRYAEMSDAELEEVLDQLGEAVELQMEREAEMERKNVEAFQNLIQDTIQLGAGDRETALRWLVDAEDIDLRGMMDVEGFLYRKGILFTEFGSELKQELSKFIKR